MTDVHNTLPCSGCFYTLSKDDYNPEEWDGDISKIRFCKSCKKNGTRRGNIVVSQAKKAETTI